MLDSSFLYCSMSHYTCIRVVSTRWVSACVCLRVCQRKSMWISVCVCYQRHTRRCLDWHCALLISLITRAEKLFTGSGLEAVLWLDTRWVSGDSLGLPGAMLLTEATYIIEGQSHQSYIDLEILLDNLGYKLETLKDSKEACIDAFEHIRVQSSHCS